MVECADLTLLAADAFAYERPRREPPSSLRRPRSPSCIARAGYATAACRVLTLEGRRGGSSPMSSLAIALVVFSCSFGAALIGMVLHVKLPDHHLDTDSRDVVKLVMGLIATMSALVLSLLIASANSSYDRQSSELKALSTTILLLASTRKFYG